jgi:SAM-dependent methyltransferase
MEIEESGLKRLMIKPSLRGSTHELRVIQHRPRGRVGVKPYYVAEAIMAAVILGLVLSLVALDKPYARSQLGSVDENAWDTFLQWLAQQPPNGDPQRLLAGYRDELMRQGSSEREATQRASAVAALAFRRPEGVRLLWDKVYAAKNSIFVDRPTELLVRAVEDRAPGTALDVGMGQGRNALFLALNKWRVSGFDPSTEGVRQARERAQSLGVNLDTEVTTDDRYDFGRDRWDLIVVTYVRNLNRSDADRFWTALRPGGLVVYENAAAAGNDVLDAFMAYRILRWEDVIAAPDWGRGEKIRIQRLVAEKR